MTTTRLITGGEGAIGRHLADLLTGLDHPVRIATRSRDPRDIDPEVRRTARTGVWDG